MVLTGLIINYPVGIFLTWLFLDVFMWTSSFLLATANTIAFSVIAVIRVYYLTVSQLIKLELQKELTWRWQEMPIRHSESKYVVQLK